MITTHSKGAQKGKQLSQRLDKLVTSDHIKWLGVV